jgi:hypothetical protein
MSAKIEDMVHGLNHECVLHVNVRFMNVLCVLLFRYLNV